MPASKADVRRIRFKWARFEAEAADRYEAANDADRARLLDVDPSNYHRISRGQTRPSDLFIAAVLAAFADHDDLNFDSFFEVEVTR